MRIAISGAANTGKSTLLQSFLYTWDNYKTPETTYRDIIKDKELDHSSKTTAENQTIILDSLIEQQKKYASLSEKVVHDRCALDALAYTLWCNGKQVDGFDEEFVKTQIAAARESMRTLDIIFLCKFDKKQVIVNDGSRDADLEYIKEVDNIFESLYQQYSQNLSADIFFPKGDSPAVIKLPDSPQERIDLIAEYVAPDGGMHSEESSILDPSNLENLEGLLKQQIKAKESEDADKELFEKFKMDTN